jgi:hypothetical protein
MTTEPAKIREQLRGMALSLATGSGPIVEPAAFDAALDSYRAAVRREAAAQLEAAAARQDDLSSSDYDQESYAAFQLRDQATALRRLADEATTCHDSATAAGRNLAFTPPPADQAETERLRAERDSLGREADRLRTEWTAMRDRAERAEADRDWWRDRAYAVQARAERADRAAVLREAADRLAAMYSDDDPAVENLRQWADDENEQAEAEGGCAHCGSSDHSWDECRAYTAAVADAQQEPPVHGESVAHLAGLHDDEQEQSETETLRTPAAGRAPTELRVRVLREILNRLDGSRSDGDSATQDVGASTVRAVLADILADMQPAVDARQPDVQVWPLNRILTEVRCGSQDWPWEEEWADLDRRHAETGYLVTLEQQIRENGITMPVLIGSDGRLWDGHHRLRIAVRVGIPYVPVEIVSPTEPAVEVRQDGAQRCPAKHGALGRICELPSGHPGMHTGSGANGSAVWDGDAP